ncbi:MAG: YciI family protein [Verrucomicrobiales bacterium]
MNPDNPQKPTDEYLLLIRGTHWNYGMSPAELQKSMTDFYAWVDGLAQAGVLLGAQPLMEEGQLVSGTRGASVTDGVFIETKEAIAGYFRVSVSKQEALRHAKACPILDYGAQIEVRPVADLCRPMAEVKAAETISGVRFAPPEIVQTGKQTIACIAIVVARGKIQSVMGPGLHELIGTVTAQGIEITGPWFAHHRRRPTDTFDFDICVPVSSAVEPAGRV